MKERIKEIRRKEKINQTEFAKSLGLSRSFIAQVETDQERFSDRTIRDICRVYGVNEEWLRTGAGEMYTPKTRKQEILEFVNDALLDADDDTKELVLYGLTELPPESWPILRDAIKRAAKLFNDKEDE